MRVVVCILCMLNMYDNICVLMDKPYIFNIHKIRTTWSKLIRSSSWSQEEPILSITIGLSIRPCAFTNLWIKDLSVTHHGITLKSSISYHDQFWRNDRSSYIMISSRETYSLEPYDVLNGEYVADNTAVKH